MGAVVSTADPMCSTGVVSVVGPKVCCAGYCGECSDYPTCASVRGQASQNACCQTKVYEQRCGGGAPANACLQSCSESVPPCIMDNEAVVVPQTGRHAGNDCNKAIQQWRVQAESATKIQDESNKTEGCQWVD